MRAPLFGLDLGVLVIEFEIGEHLGGGIGRWIELDADAAVALPANPAVHEAECGAFEADDGACRPAKRRGQVDGRAIDGYVMDAPRHCLPQTYDRHFQAGAAAGRAPRLFHRVRPALRGICFHGHFVSLCL